jgi:hypothetical protein
MKGPAKSPLSCLFCPSGNPDSFALALASKMHNIRMLAAAVAVTVTAAVFSICVGKNVGWQSCIIRPSTNHGIGNSRFVGNRLHFQTFRA